VAPGVLVAEEEDELFEFDPNPLFEFPPKPEFPPKLEDPPNPDPFELPKAELPPPTPPLLELKLPELKAEPEALPFMLATEVAPAIPAPPIPPSPPAMVTPGSP
jgi:hypothetical protein